ncbi:ubiquitin-conjugating enzyme, variant 2 [Trifolium repens]|nr:ubiquitin-conjugating enzyme, variant 2 [Trifolium repens]
MIRQDQAGGVHLTSTLFRRKTTASIPKSVTRLFNKTISHNVFDIDNGDDSEDLVILGEKFGNSNKGKAIEVIHQVVNASDDAVCQLSVENLGQITAIESSNGYPMVSHNSINVDGHGSIMSYENGDDSEELVILGEEVSKSNKGKAIEAIHQIVEVSDNNLCQFGVEKFRTVSATGPLVSNDIINIDCHGSDLSYGDGYDSKDLVIIDEEVSKSNKGKQIEAPHQVVPSIEYFGPTSGIESSNGSPLVYLSYDDGDDSDDLMIIGEEVNKRNNKGKTIEAIHQEVSDHTFCQPAEKSIGSVAQDVIDIDDDDDFDDLMIIGEDASKSNKGKTVEVIPEVVEHLDNIDVPSRTEAPFTALRESDKGLRRSAFESSTCNDTQSAATNINPRQPPTSTNSESATKATSVCNSSSMNQAHLDNINMPSRTEAPFTSFRDSGIGLRRSTFESSNWYGTYDSTGTQFSSPLFYQATPNKRKSTASTPPTSANLESAKKARLNNVDIATPNKRKSTTPTTSADFRSAKKAHLDNVDISYEIGAPFTLFSESNLGSRKSALESSTCYGTQSKATNSHSKASSRSSQLSKSANSKIQRSTMGSSNFQIEMDTVVHSFGIGLSASQLYSGASHSKKKSAALQSVAGKKKAASSMRLLDASKPSAATKNISGKKAVGSGSKNRQATSSSNPSLLLDSGALMGSSLFSHSVSSKKKADAPMRLLTASKPSAATKTVSGKKAVGSGGSKNSRATSSSKPSQSLDSGALMGSSLFSRSVSSKTKAETPMRLIHASKPPASTKILSGKKAVGSGSKKSYATSSSKPSQSLYSGNSKIQESIISISNLQINFYNFDYSSETLLSSFKLSSQGAPSSMTKQAAPSCLLLQYKWQVL